MSQINTVQFQYTFLEIQTFFISVSVKSNYITELGQNGYIWIFDGSCSYA